MQHPKMIRQKTKKKITAAIDDSTISTTLSDEAVLSPEVVDDVLAVDKDLEVPNLEVMTVGPSTVPKGVLWSSSSLSVVLDISDSVVSTADVDNDGDVDNILADVVGDSAPSVVSCPDVRVVPACVVVSSVVVLMKWVTWVSVGCDSGMVGENASL